MYYHTHAEFEMYWDGTHTHVIDGMLAPFETETTPEDVTKCLTEGIWARIPTLADSPWIAS